MSLSERDISRAIQNIAVYLVHEIEKQNQCSQNEALELLMKTAVYETLLDKETMLYCESKEAVFGMLKAELNSNIKELLVV